MPDHLKPVRRSNRRVFQIAELAGCEAQEALSILRTHGMPVHTENDLVSQDMRETALALVREATNRKVPRTAECTSPEKSETSAEKPLGARRRRKDVVGHRSQDLLYLKADEVEEIHWYLVRDFERSRDPISPPGIRDRNLLESALLRVHTSLAGEMKYPTIPMAAAAYLHAIIGNHAFHNGNKRTALVATLVFLDLNGHVLVAEEDELFDYLLAIAAHNLPECREADDRADCEMREIARWLHRHIRERCPVRNVY